MTTLNHNSQTHGGATGDPPEAPPMMHERMDPQTHRRLAELIKDIRVAMLLTVTEHLPSGHARTAERCPMRVRPMYTQKVDPATFAGQLWFMTDAHSAKVHELQHNAQMLVSYAHPDKNIFVAVYGKGFPEHNPVKARELWNMHTRGWWPEGPESDRLRLIRLDVDYAEYWEGPSQPSYLLQLASALVTGNRLGPMGEHGTVST